MVFNNSILSRTNLNLFSGGLSEVLFQRCSKYLGAGAKVASFILGNMPGGASNDGVKSDFEIICNLTATLLSEIKSTELGDSLLKIRCIANSFFHREGVFIR